VPESALSPQRKLVSSAAARANLGGLPPSSFARLIEAAGIHVVTPAGLSRIHMFYEDDLDRLIIVRFEVSA
jgi:hypothetical protein